MKSRFQILYSIFLLLTAIFVGIRHDLIRKVFALTETTYTFPDNTAFNAEGYDDDSGVVAVGGTAVSLARNSSWWDLDWRYKIPVTVKNLGSSQVTANSTAQITVNLTTLGLGTTKLQSDLDDLRVVYSTGATHTEIARSVVQQVGATNVATISFPLSATLSAGATDTTYALYYGNPDASSPSGSGYDIGNKSATLVCPFNGTTTCVDGETPSTETGAIRYSRNSALSFESDDNVSIANITEMTTGSGTFTAECWYRPTRSPDGVVIGKTGFNNGISVSGETASCSMWNTDNTSFSVSGAISNNTWHHIACQYDSSNGRVSLYVDGEYKGENFLTGAVRNNGTTLYINKQRMSTTGVTGITDEVRLSTVIRYTENFTPSTASFQTDANTKLLLHFDENGDDPRNTGKAMDASGNGNHGTITGAKYVSGLVGVDSSATDYGKVWPQSYASHNGIFIEEGTTNLIANPSFENTSSYNTGWSLPYENLGDGTTAFTVGMSKRNSAGPFAAGITPQGPLSSAGAGDTVYASFGNQISGNFYEYLDSGQGSISFWVTPEWDGDDNLTHHFFYTDASISVLKNNNNLLYLQIYDSGWRQLTVDVSDWIAGQTYLVIAGWDYKNTLDGTNKAYISINNVSHLGMSVLNTSDISWNHKLYSGVTNYPANAVIEGMTIYRRPLWDGEYGIDVGNGDEIEQIWNLGAGKDPTLVTGSWDVVFALPTNASAGTLSTGTGEAWTHPHSSNVLGVGGFMMGTGYTGDGWAMSTPSDMVVYSDVGSTFTAGMSKRNSAGPFAAGVMTQGNLSGGGTGDVVVAERGDQISGDWYDLSDSNQGSIVFWITPEWDGDDGLEHYIVDTGSGGIFRFSKRTNNILVFNLSNQLMFTYDASSWISGDTYLVTLRWDLDNTLDGTNYASVTVDTSTTFGIDSSPASVLPGDIEFGSSPSNAIVEGLTIYRRPLWDGEYGINVGNGDEIEQIYNNGTGKDPTLVTGSWDVVFALPTNASAGTLSTGTGEAWTHPHSSNVLGTGGFMMNGTYTDDGWGDVVPSVSSTLSTDLISYWKMDEASNENRLDEVGSNDLTDAGITDQVEGKLNYSVSFPESGINFMQKSSPVDVTFGDEDFSIGGWLYLDRKDAYAYAVSKWFSSSATDSEYRLYYNYGTDRFAFRVYDGTGSFTTVDADNLGSPSTGTWYYVTAWHDSINNQIGIQINDGTPDFEDHTTGVNQGSNSLIIGNNNTGLYEWSGRIDELGIWGKVLSSDERSELYNSGSGKEHPFTGEGSAAIVSALDSSEKIYAGGYKWTNSVANQGIGYTLTGLTAGQNYVVRAVVHSDGTAVPKVQIWDDTNNAEITSLTGSTGTGRTDPDVLLFTFELPTTARYGSSSDSTAIEVRLLNTESSGTVYWHQVEVLENLIDNPSLEVGSTATGPWIPGGWSNYNMESADSVQEESDIHSGDYAFKLQSNSCWEGAGVATASLGTDKFVSEGVYYKKISGTDLPFWGYSPSAAGRNFQYVADSNYCSTSLVQTSWSHAKRVTRERAGGNKTIVVRASLTGSSVIADDLYAFALDDVSLTVTPANQSNSTETTGLRVDGGDALVRLVSELTTGSGTVRFTMTPRHNFDIGSSFGIANPVIMQAYLDGDNYIKVHKSDATTLQLLGRFNATEISVGWTNPTLDVGTSYGMEVNYTSGGSMNLLVDGVNVGTTSGVVDFSVAPNLIYFGTDNGGGGSNPYDLTISSYEASAEVEALATAEKIYGGGYKWTNLTSNQGIGKTLTGLTAGQNYVVRAVVHSDGTAIPKVQIWDDTNDEEITSLTGSTGTGRTDPDVLLFTFELPTTARYGSSSDSTAIEVRLLNTESSGTVYWHQVELLENLIDNPSLEVGSTDVDDNWIPTGWVDVGLESGESLSEADQKNSGSGSLLMSANDIWELIRQSYSRTLGKYYSSGIWMNVVSGSVAMEMAGNRAVLQSTNTSLIEASRASWTLYPAVYRQAVDLDTLFEVGSVHSGGGIGYYDDVYYFPLDDVSLTVTPASQTNSSESTGLRVDGGDLLSQEITNNKLQDTKGGIKFKFTPRHSFGIGSSFGFSQPVIFEAYGDADDFIKMEKIGSSLATTVSMAGTTAVASWTAPVLNAGTSYPIEISYLVGGSLAVSVGGTQRASVNLGAGTSFGTVPTMAYFGSDSSGTNQYDATYSDFESLAAASNAAQPYYKFGSQSVKLTNSINNDQYTINVGATNTNTLSAYVYNGTTVGGTVDDTIAQLYFANQAIGTTYADQGGGWWRLTGTVTGTGATVPAGVEVKAGKTVYVDGVQLEQKTYATTYADGSLGTGYAWSGTENNSNSSRSAGRISYQTNGNFNLSNGVISFWYKPDFSNSLADRHYLLQVGEYWSSNSLTIRQETDKLMVYLKDQNGVEAISDTSRVFNPVMNNWYHIVMYWSSGDSRFYINNVQRFSDSSEFSVTTPSAFYVGGHHAGTGANNEAKAVFSDLRIYNDVLTESEVSDLYWQGLMTHSNGDEGVDRYNASGTYISPVVDLGIIGAWGSSAFVGTTSLNGGDLDYYTRSSADNESWSDWVGTVGTSIVSDPRQYFQWKVDLSSNNDQSETPEITGMVVSYAEDSTAPTNPSDLATVYSAGVGTTELVSESWYNYTSPSFVWGSGVDTGDGASGVEGYHLLLSSDIGATPTSNVADACYAYVTDAERQIQVGSGDWSDCELSNGIKYLLLQSQDNSGNVAEPVSLFVYKYDGSNPAAPSSVSSTTVGYTATNEFTFYWPSALDTGPAGIYGYEYKTGTTDPSDAFYDWQYTAGVQVTSVTAYKEGQNTFYVRSVDNAGNYSTMTSNIGVAMFYFNETAPTAVQNVTITPASNAAQPADTNSFTVTWDKPESYSGEILKYYYCVNCVPGAGTMTEMTAGQTAERTLTNMALATVQGKNTFYIVAEDNNIDSETGYGNRNFEAYAEADFYASTIAPASPTNLTISDASDRSADKWRLTLAWDVGSTTSTTSNVAGLAQPDHYEVYRSTDNSTFASVGTVTGTAYTDASLTQSQIYYYKIKAIDNAGAESAFSNTVNETPEGKYTSPPSAGGTPTVTAGSSTATIAWVTGREAWGTVEYGKDSSYGSASSGSEATTTHSIKLTGLAPDTTYHYRVSSLDESALVGYERSEANSADYSFTTLASAEISDITIEEVGLETAVVSWKTSTVASTEIDYGKSETYGSNQTISTTASENTHTARLSNLDHSSVYHFRIKGVTVDGTDIYSQDMTFETITYPKIEAYVLKTDQAAGGTSIAVAWSTNVKTTSVVQYKAVEIENLESGIWNLENMEEMSQVELAKIPVISNTDQWQEVSKSDLSLTHILKIKDLEDGAMYIIQFRGRDEFGNEVVSDPVRYVTGADTRAPVISDVTIETQIAGTGSAGTASIVVSWETDEPATTQVVYSAGTDGDYNLESPKEEGLTKRHVVVVRDLETNSSYHLQIRSSDETGNEAKSEDLIAVTPGAEESALDVVLMNLEEVFSFLRI